MTPAEHAALDAHLESLGSPLPPGEAHAGDFDAWLARAAGRPAFELWGKAQPTPAHRWPAHPLLCHQLDVAAVAARLLTRFVSPALATFLLRIDADRARALRFLLLVVALHDLGKATPAFQAKADALMARLRARGFDAHVERRDLHHGDIGMWLAQPALEGLGLTSDAAASLARAVTAHHGQFPLDSTQDAGASARQLGSSPRWVQARHDVIRELRSFFHLDGADAPALLTGAVVHGYVIALAGLTSVADWLGSAAEVFEYEAPPTSLAAYWPVALGRADETLRRAGFTAGATTRARTFAELFPRLPSRWPLHEAAEAVAPRLDAPSLVVVEAPMGEGKTEAALLLAEASAANAGSRGLYVGLPTQATANQMFGRLCDFLTEAHPDETNNLLLAHSEASLVEKFATLRLNAVYDLSTGTLAGRPDTRGAVRAEGWFLSKKRALLADWAVGTIDQALLSVMLIPHGFVRLYGLAGKTVVLDEVHAYDTYTGTLLDRLLEWLAAMGTTVLLLSATLPRHRRDQLCQAYARGRRLPASIAADVGYPRITVVTAEGTSATSFGSRRPPLTVPLGVVDVDPSVIVERALAAVDEGGCVGCVFNTVGRAQQAFALARQRRPDLEHRLLLHARLLPEERLKREHRLEEWLGPPNKTKDRPERALVIGTQVLEQSLDVDFDVLFTDLAPVDLVLQRSGRLFRHERDHRSPARPAPQLFVACPATNSAKALEEVAPIYSRLLVRRTLAALAARAAITLPDDIEPLIEEVYRRRDPPAEDDPEYQDFIAFVGAARVEQTLAQQKLLCGPTTPDDPFGSLKVFLDDDDDPLLHAQLRAATRLGPPSIEIVCLERTSAGVLTLGDDLPFLLDDEPDRTTTTRLVRRSVGITHRGVVPLLGKIDPPKAWQSSALLRYRRPVVFERPADGAPPTADVGTFSLRLDPELGLTIESLYGSHFVASQARLWLSPGRQRWCLCVKFAHLARRSRRAQQGARSPTMPDPFNLTSRPWVPCEWLDGTRAELSTRDALVEAHRLRGLVDPSPLVLAVLHRHLLAVLHRAYGGPKNLDEWAAIVQGDRFDAARVERYLESVRERMCLFHPTHPFAQTPGLVQQFKADPIDMLSLERSSWGTARSLFQHRPHHHRATMAPAEAARALLAHHAFATGGLVKKPNEPTSATAAPLVRSAVVVLRGDTLFRTLVANLLCYHPEENLPIAGNAGDVPSWEAAPPPSTLPVSEEPKRLPNGWLDLLTWLSRRIELVREGDEVTGFVRAVGQGLHEATPLDPMVAYRADEKRGWVSLGLDPERAFWRDANVFFEAGTDDPKGVRRPLTVEQASTLKRKAALGRAAARSLELYGISAYQSLVYVVRAERVGAAVRHFADPDAGDVVKRALRAAEDSVDALQGALYSYARNMLSEGDRNPEAKDVRAFANSLGGAPAAWSALGLEFDRLLRGLDEPDKEAALDAFKRAARRVVAKTFEGAVAGADGTARSLKARAVAERSLQAKLAQLVTLTPSAETAHG
jgi:CRISPR-associated endonuclease/helicase Cas3